MAEMRDDSFAVMPAWEHSSGVQSAELAATWARVTIDVGADRVTWVERDGTSRDGVYVSAYPLAEWIVFNWWSLRAELRASVHPAREWTWALSSPDSWLHRHNLRAAGSGMSWPDLAIVPEGAVTCLRWFSRGPGPGERGLRYLGAGTAWLSTESVQQGLERFVEAVVDRLRGAHVAETPLEREWERIRDADPDDVEFAEAVARLGLDPYSVDGSMADRVMALEPCMDRAMLGEFLDSANPRSLALAQSWIADADDFLKTRVSRNTQLPVPIDERPESSIGVGSKPWQAGYRAARDVRKALGLKPRESADLGPLIDVHDLRADSGGIEGYVVAHARPALVIPEGVSRSRRRFHAAHALGLSVLAPSRHRFVIDPSSTELSQAARAFAAELLAPAEGVSQYLVPLGAATEAAFDAIAQRFDTSPAVVRWQYDNQIGSIEAESLAPMP